MVQQSQVDIWKWWATKVELTPSCISTSNYLCLFRAGNFLFARTRFWVSRPCISRLCLHVTLTLVVNSGPYAHPQNIHEVMKRNPKHLPGNTAARNRCASLMDSNCARDLRLPALFFYNEKRLRRLLCKAHLQQHAITHIEQLLHILCRGCHNMRDALSSLGWF